MERGKGNGCRDSEDKKEKAEPCPPCRCPQPWARCAQDMWGSLPPALPQLSTALPLPFAVLQLHQSCPAGFLRTGSILIAAACSPSPRSETELPYVRNPNSSTLQPQNISLFSESCCSPVPGGAAKHQGLGRATAQRTLWLRRGQTQQIIPRQRDNAMEWIKHKPSRALAAFSSPPNAT